MWMLALREVAGRAVDEPQRGAEVIGVVELDAR